MPKRHELKPKKKPSQDRSRDTVDVILQATSFLLNERGYDALTTNRIAARAGVNIATLYQYFPNKQAVFAELMRRHASQTRAAALAVLEAERDGGLAATIRALVEANIAMHKITPRLHRIFTEEGPRLGIGVIESPSDLEMRRRAAAFCDSARGRLENPELVLWIATTAVHSLIHLAIVERPDDFASPEFAEELTRLVTAYLAREPARGGT